MRKIMKKGMVALIVTALVVTPVSPADAAAKKVALSKKKIVLQAGGKQTIKVKNTKKKVKWSIKSGKKYIKLQKKKKNSVVVRAKKTGSAKVQAKVGKKKYICKVTVRKAKVKPTATPLWTAPPSSVLKPTDSPSDAKKPEATATSVPVEKNADQVQALQAMIQKINKDIRAELDEEEIAEGGYLVSTDLDDETQYEWDASGNLSMINWDDKGIIEEKLSFAAFPGLRELYCQSNDGLEGIDVTGNPKLEDLFCYDDGLEALNVNSNPELKELNCYGNSIEAKYFKYNKCTKIQTFRCGFNSTLNSINVSNMPDLKTLDCSDSMVSTTIDVSVNEKLVELNCSGNNEMGEKGAKLIVDNNPMLKILDCSDCGLSSLDVSNSPLLEKLDCSGNNLESLNTDNNERLQTLDCGGNGYTAEVPEPSEGEGDDGTTGDDFADDAVGDTGTDNGSDVGSDSDEQPITLQMDVSKNPALEKLICYGNGLYSLDVSNNPDLTYLNCSDNYLKDLDVSHNTKLSVLNCTWNNLTSLNLTMNPLLWESVTLQYDEGVQLIQN